METLQALLIGIDRYDPNPLVKDLHGAVADVQAMEEFLLRCGVPRENITKLTSSHSLALRAAETAPTYEAMVDGIRDLARRAQRTSGQALVHYSGHGGRIKTLIPGSKGAEGLDEGLVPSRLDGSNARFLHDVELTFLLDEMARGGVPVTMILDSCHSGGMMRRAAAGIRRRRAKSIHDGERRTESRVASLEDLERVWQKTHHRSWRHGRRDSSGWTSKGVLEQQHVAILAACRKRESAFERDFGDGPRGAFTHGLLELLCRGAALDSWEDARRKLVRRMQRLAPAQWPVFEGSPPLALFQGLRKNRERPIEVVEVDGPRQRVLLNAGVALAVGKGALLEVRSRGEAASQAVVVEVEEAAVGEAWAVVRGDGADFGKIEPGDAAVVVDPGEDFRRRVAWVVEGEEQADGSGKASRGRCRSGAEDPPTPGALALVRLELEKRKSGFLEMVAAGAPGPPADFQVAVGAEGFEVLQADGRPLPGLPNLGRVSRKAARRLVDQLLHLTRFQLVRDLANNDERSSLCGALVAELGLLPVGYKPGDRCEAMPLDSADGAPQVPAGRWIALDVSNRSQQALHLYVLDLQPDWGIEIIHPRSGLTTLEGGREIRLPLELYLPQGARGGHEILQVLGLAEPARPKALCLPPIKNAGQPWRTSTGGPLGPLGRLLQQCGAEGRRWRSAAFRNPNYYWAAAQVEFELLAERPPRGGVGSSEDC